VLDVVERERVPADLVLRFAVEVADRAHAVADAARGHGVQHQRVVGVDPERHPPPEAERAAIEGGERSRDASQRGVSRRARERGIVERVAGRVVVRRAGGFEGGSQRGRRTARLGGGLLLARIQDRHRRGILASEGRPFQGIEPALRDPI